MVTSRISKITVEKRNNSVILYVTVNLFQINWAEPDLLRFGWSRAWRINSTLSVHNNSTGRLCSLEEPSRILYIRSMEAITTDCLGILNHCAYQHKKYVSLQNGHTEITAPELWPPSYVLPSSVAGLPCCFERHKYGSRWVPRGLQKPSSSLAQASSEARLHNAVLTVLVYSQLL